MTRLRAVAALAALLSALVVQGGVIGPLVVPAAASLPAVLVAAVALVDGPGAGLALGFASGLIADLASEHPAGVLALCWMGLGLACGLLADERARRRRDIAWTAFAATAASLVTALLLTVVASATDDLVTSVRHVGVVAVTDLVLAFAVVPLTRLFLHSEALRAAQPALALGGRR